MPDAEPHSHLAENRRDIACPGCDYNLRGLRGDVVTCPECGATCDIGQLVARRWTKPWYYAPGLNWVMLPCAYALRVALSTRFIDVDKSTVLAVAVLLLIGWLLLMYRAWRVFRSPVGVALALLMHVALAAKQCIREYLRVGPKTRPA